MWPFEDFFAISKLFAFGFHLPCFCQVVSRSLIISKSFLGINGRLVLEHWITGSSKAEGRIMAWHLHWTYGVWSILVCLNSLLDSEYKIQCQRCINCNYLENNDLKIKYLIVQQSYTPKCYQCHGFTVDTVHICSLRWFCLLTVHTTKPKTQYRSLRSQGLCNDMRLLGYSVSVVISL